MVNGVPSRFYSGRENRRAQRQAAQTKVREDEWETKNAEVAPFQQKPVRILLSNLMDFIPIKEREVTKSAMLTLHLFVSRLPLIKSLNRINRPTGPM